jgi:hypothetical protein
MLKYIPPPITVINGGSSHSGLLIRDNNKFLRFDLKDPKAEKFSEAIGFVVYSYSKVNVSSLRSFVELIWNNHVQYEKIRQFEQQLAAEKMMAEFLDITGHELRTGVQSDCRS